MPYIQHQLNGAIVNHYPIDMMEIENSVLSIGRSNENDIQLDDATVSAQHAVIESTESGVQVRDLNSTNGVFLNGKKLGRGDTSVLSVGDVMVIGAHDFSLINELPNEMDKTLKIKKSWIPGVYYTEE